jgi:NADH:ubiquinone oxidoreductase subunit
MFGFINRLLTWWHNATIGTHIFTWRKGRLVGTDAEGNRYYEEKAPAAGRKPRRWVIYNGPVEASRVPADWHGWMHHIVDTPPESESYQPRPWQKPHSPNLTGTPLAYRPRGSLAREAQRPPATGDYDAWSPSGDDTRAA